MSIIDNFCLSSRQLLKQEQAEEIDELKTLHETFSIHELEACGEALLKVHCVGRRTGLLGRELVTFGRGRAPIQRGGHFGDVEIPVTLLLKAHRFSHGDIVSISSSAADDEPLTGVVYKQTEHSVTVVIDVQKSSPGDALIALDPDDNAQAFTLLRLVNEATHNRMVESLTRLRESIGDKAVSANIRRVLFGLDKFGVACPAPHDIGPARLNASQWSAVQKSLLCEDVCLIHGPPGTGKTVTLVELISRAVMQGERVLVCAPSNVACDTLVERLAAIRGLSEKIIRLGHPARLLTHVLEFSLDARVRASDEAKLVVDVRNELDEARRRARRDRYRPPDDDNVPPPSSHAEDIGALRRELRQRENRIVEQVIERFQIVVCTLIGAAQLHSFAKRFERVIIDEAAQALEPASWVALLLARRAVLAGDHLQLGPTIHSESARIEGLGCTLFDRLIPSKGDDEVGAATSGDGDSKGTGSSSASSSKGMPVKKTKPKVGSLPRCIGPRLQAPSYFLDRQYRMNGKIMAFSNEALYQGRIVADSSVKEHTLADLDGVVASELTRAPLVFIDTAGCDMADSRPSDDPDSNPTLSQSVANPGEAGLVCTLIRTLVESGLKEESIGVITPYSAQVSRIRELIHSEYPGMEVSTVDGFQGREKEAIVISCVRSNVHKEVGFLTDRRRMNVALTRARRQVCVIADSSTLESDPFLHAMIRHFYDHGDVKSASDAMFSVEGGDPVSYKAPSEKSGKQVNRVARQAPVRAQASSGKGLKAVSESGPSGFKRPPGVPTVSKPSIRRVPQAAPESESSFINPFMSLNVEDGTHEPRNDSNVESDTTSEDMASPQQPVAGQEEQATSAAKKKKKKKKKKTAGTQGGSQTADRDGDQDDVFDEILRASRLCSFDECREKIGGFGLPCNLCHGTFCGKHGLPEIHGCGAAARARARDKWRDGQGSATLHMDGSKKKSLSAQSRRSVSNKLKEALNAQGRDRRPAHARSRDDTSARGARRGGRRRRPV